MDLQCIYLCEARGSPKTSLDEYEMNAVGGREIVGCEVMMIKKATARHTWSLKNISYEWLYFDTSPLIADALLLCCIYDLISTCTLIHRLLVYL